MMLNTFLFFSLSLIQKTTQKKFGSRENRYSSVVFSKILAMKQ